MNIGWVGPSLVSVSLFMSGTEVCGLAREKVYTSGPLREEASLHILNI